MSAARVPGLVLRRADSSALLLASTSTSPAGPVSGLCGPNCNSGIGGGDGSLGELAGDIAPRAGVPTAAIFNLIEVNHTVRPLNETFASVDRAQKSHAPTQNLPTWYRADYVFHDAVDLLA